MQISFGLIKIGKVDNIATKHLVQVTYSNFQSIWYWLNSNCSWDWVFSRLLYWEILQSIFTLSFQYRKQYEHPPNIASGHVKHLICYASVHSIRKGLCISKAVGQLCCLRKVENLTLAQFICLKSTEQIWRSQEHLLKYEDYEEVVKSW